MLLFLSAYDQPAWSETKVFRVILLLGWQNIQTSVKEGKKEDHIMYLPDITISKGITIVKMDEEVDM